MPFAAALSTDPDTAGAFEAVGAQALERLGGKPDLALAFFSQHHAGAADAVAAVRKRLGARWLVGCNAEAVVGNDREVEQQPAISLWLARWAAPIEAEPFHLTLERTSEGHSLIGWPDGLDDANPAESAVLLLGDPFTFPTDAFLNRLNEDHSGLRVFGGMASGAPGPGDSRLLLGNRVLQDGAVGLLLQGAAGIRTVVSQGCRPIGRPLVITKAQENRILGLGGKPPLVQLQSLWEELAPADRALVQHGLHLGRVINEYQGQFRRGDFLVRNVLGVDQETGALAITDRVRAGQTVQFHVRDADTADEDLHALLKADRADHPQPTAGALLFTCNGRGTRLFSGPDHDARAVRAEAGELPLAGFFAAGELGPVGGQNFIHGFTASVVLFEE